MILQFWRSELRNKFHRTKVKQSICLVPSGAFEGRIHFFHIIQLLAAARFLGLWLLPPSSKLITPNSFHRHLNFSASDPSCIPLIRTFVIILGPPNNPG